MDFVVDKNIIDELSFIKENMNSFNRYYIELEPLKNNQEFIGFRRSLLEHIIDVFNIQLESDSHCMKLYKLLHGAFFVFNKIKDSLQNFSFSLEPHFKFMLYSALFIICKFNEKNGRLDRQNENNLSPYEYFKSQALSKDYPLKVIFKLENLILESVDWNIDSLTPFELFDLIFSSKTILNEINQFNAFESVKQIFKNYVLFSIDDFKLLLKHGEYFISLAAIIISLKHYNLQISLAYVENQIKNVSIMDYEMVVRCEIDILVLLNLNEDGSQLYPLSIHMTSTCYNTDESPSMFQESILQESIIQESNIEESIIQESNNQESNIHENILLTLQLNKTGLNVSYNTDYKLFRSSDIEDCIDLQESKNNSNATFPLEKIRENINDYEECDMINKVFKSCELDNRNKDKLDKLDFENNEENYDTFEVNRISTNVDDCVFEDLNRFDNNSIDLDDNSYCSSEECSKDLDFKMFMQFEEGKKFQSYDNIRKLIKSTKKTERRKRKKKSIGDNGNGNHMCEFKFVSTKKKDSKKSKNNER